MRNYYMVMILDFDVWINIAFYSNLTISVKIEWRMFNYIDYYYYYIDNFRKLFNR